MAAGQAEKTERRYYLELQFSWRAALFLDPPSPEVTRLYTFVGTAIGSYAGWYVGAAFGMMTAFMLSIVGTGVGFYFARKVAIHYQP